MFNNTTRPPEDETDEEGRKGGAEARNSEATRMLQIGLDRKIRT